MLISIDDLEHAAAPGWRAIEEGRLGDWLLRAAGGFTGRANSALAAGDPGLALPEAVAKVGSWYADRGLPAMIVVPYPAAQPDASRLDRLLADLGWAIRADAATVMTAGAGAATARGDDAAGVTAAGGPGVEIGPDPDEAWLARYHYRGQELPPVARTVLTSAPWQAFGSIRVAGETVAIGRVAGPATGPGLPRSRSTRGAAARDSVRRSLSG